MCKQNFGANLFPLITNAYITDEVQVTCLKYIPQSGSLAIGYSFGGFHLWKLFNPVLE